ncbi:MAG TPA: NAD(P)-binding protein, partial [Pyrinomonadaceae bacterium]|nr:NAD(P)-binding protein [Pyrinomonadaceae bacterium]
MSRALDDPVDFHKRTERKVDQNPHILVAGAGIGGLALALALLRKGIDATVFEQAPELKPLGAGLQISPNGTRVLQDLEMSQALEGSYCETGSREVRLWNTGQTWPLF